MFNKCQLFIFTFLNKGRVFFRGFSKSHSKFFVVKQSKELFEKKFYTRLKQDGYCYIYDPDSCSSIATHLCKEWKNGFILEANPGPGYLSKAILNSGISCLRVFEKNPEFLTSLKELSVHHQNLEIIQDDIILLPAYETKVADKEPNFSDIFFENILEQPWEEGPPCRFFSVVFGKRSIKFIRYLLAALPTRSSIFSLGRCDFFLLLPETEFSYINAEPKENFSTYRWVTVLYNLFFEVKCLQKYSANILFPVPARKKKKASNEQFFYLVNLTPKSDLFSLTVNGNKLPEFYFFVRHHLIKRSGLVIPTMEGWIPSCGPRLIKEGMNVFTKFGDLSPKQLLLLFNQFTSWPEYEDSSFCAAVQRYYGKGSLPYDDEENS